MSRLLLSSPTAVASHSYRISRTHARHETCRATRSVLQRVSHRRHHAQLLDVWRVAVTVGYGELPLPRVKDFPELAVAVLGKLLCRLFGVLEATTGGMKPYYRNNQLGVDGWQAGNTAKATIYNVGVMMVTSIDNWDGTPISTSNLANGVYIFKVNNNTIKFVKQ